MKSLILIAALLATSFNACSKVGFGAEDALTLQSTSGGPDSGDAVGNLNQTGLIITNPTITGITVTGGTVGANGVVTGGTITGGTITGGTIVGGPNNGSTITGGTITGGTINGGTVTGGTVGPGGTITGGTLTGGTITGGTITGGTTTGGPTTGTGTGGPGTGTGTVTGGVPSVRFVGPPCHINTSCQAQFVLDHALNYSFSFHWHTNDTAYTYPAPGAGVIYGRPNLHYVPTLGDLTFQAGETTKTVYIQNINPDASVAIVIQVVMSQCTFGGTAYACASVFH